MSELLWNGFDAVAAGFSFVLDSLVDYVCSYPLLSIFEAFVLIYALRVAAWLCAKGLVWLMNATEHRRIAKEDAARKREGKDGREWGFANIPSRPTPGLTHKAYPQVRRYFDAAAFEDIVNENCQALQNICRAIPHTPEELDSYILPVIRNTIRYIHLLPASRNDHHYGRGGLIAHSLDVALRAVRASKNYVYPFREGETQKQIFYNRQRWIVLCMFAGLLHDIGKVWDMRVTDAEGNVWDSASESLLDWIERTGIKEYYVDWKGARPYKDGSSESKPHERSSQDIGMNMIIPKKTLDWLIEFSGIKFRSELHDALGGFECKALQFVHSADAASVAYDKEQRGQIDPSARIISSPVTEPIIEAIRACIAKGRWKINTPGAYVFVTDEGVFLRKTEEVARDIRSEAVSLGFKSVPPQMIRIAQIFADEWIASVRSDCTDPDHDALGVYAWTWKICTVATGRSVYECLRMDTPSRLFPDTLPPQITAAVMGMPLTAEKRKAWKALADFIPQTVKETKQEQKEAEQEKESIEEEKEQSQPQECCDVEPAEFAKDEVVPSKPQEAPDDGGKYSTGGSIEATMKRILNSHPEAPKVAEMKVHKDKDRHGKRDRVLKAESGEAESKGKGGIDVGIIKGGDAKSIPDRGIHLKTPAQNQPDTRKSLMGQVDSILGLGKHSNAKAKPLESQPKAPVAHEVNPDAFDAGYGSNAVNLCAMDTDPVEVELEKCSDGRAASAGEEQTVEAGKKIKEGKTEASDAAVPAREVARLQDAGRGVADVMDMLMGLPQKARGSRKEGPQRPAEPCAMQEPPAADTEQEDGEVDEDGGAVALPVSGKVSIEAMDSFQSVSRHSDAVPDILTQEVSRRMPQEKRDKVQALLGESIAAQLSDGHGWLVGKVSGNSGEFDEVPLKAVFNRLRLEMRMMDGVLRAARLGGWSITRPVDGKILFTKQENSANQ